MARLSGSVDLTADLASREITGAGVDSVHAIVCVDVSVSIALFHRLYQCAERMARKRSDQIRRCNRAFGENAVRPASGWGKWASQERNDRTIHTYRS